MATPTSEELDRQLDEFIDKLVEDKDQLPTGQLDDAFWKVRRMRYYYFYIQFIIYILGSRTASIFSQRNARRWC